MNRRQKRRKNPVDKDLQAKVVKIIKADLNDEDLLLELSDPVLWKGGIKEYVQAEVLSYSGTLDEDIDKLFMKWGAAQIDWDRVWRETEIADVWEARDRE